MQNLLQYYLNDYIGESEAPRRYHQWCFLASVAALLGRRYKLPFGNGEVYPNMYTMLIGGPASRKTTSIITSVKVLREFGFGAISANKTTKEKFLLDLCGHQDDTGAGHLPMDINGRVKDLDTSEDTLASHEMFVTPDEFVNFVGAGNYEFISLLGELWDCPDKYVNRVKNSRSFVVKEPCVNILAGNTPTGFAAAFPPNIIGQGFISRLILVYGERTDVRHTIPKKASEDAKVKLMEELQTICALCAGEATLSQEAFDALDWLYKNWEDIDDVRFANYSGRRFTHLLKLCIVFAACNKRTNIEVEDVTAANTLLTITEEEMPKALGEFGKSKYSDVSNKVIELVNNAEGPVSLTELWKHAVTDLEKQSQLTDIVVGLVRAEKLQQTKVGFLPLKKPKKETGKFFDLNLIGGR